MATDHQIHQINAIQTRFIRDFGKRILMLGSPTLSMVCIEGIIAGLVMSVARVYNKNPIEFINELFPGMRQRITDATMKEIKK